jgi:hypothetical protein
MPSGKSNFGYAAKYRNHLMLIEHLMKDKAPEKITEMKRMEDVYYLLRSYPTIGSFLAYQYTIDINYSILTSFDEMEFVVPGPGAISGISKCFIDLGDYSETEIIKYVAENQEREFNIRGLNFKNLWGRPLQLIDCQNLFCEVDKYARYAHPDITGTSIRRRIKQQFNYNPENIDYWYPPKWGINPRISNNFKLHEEFSGQYC